MKEYLVVTPDYPSENNKYATAFVHSRVKKYAEAGLKVEVFKVNRRIWGKPLHGEKYNYENIDVECGNLHELKQKIINNNYKKILVHFGYKSVISLILSVTKETPIIIWFHGSDIISWRRRTYNLTKSNCLRFFVYSFLNVFQRKFLKKIFTKYPNQIYPVFVSKWLHEVGEEDIGLKGKIKNYNIIPNIIDEDLFVYQKKIIEDRFNFLTIRSFDTRKYANDMVTEAIIKLANKSFFSQLHFTICGKGKMWNNLTKPLKKYKNVELNNNFFNHKEIVDLHKQHGVMLMPSRQDTHGISTCEGMSSGLVAISSNNSAIPEYVPSNCSYLIETVDDIVNAIEDIYNNKDKYLDYSQKSAEFIRNKCSSKIVIKKELEIIAN